MHQASLNLVSGRSKKLKNGVREMGHFKPEVDRPNNDTDLTDCDISFSHNTFASSFIIYYYCNI